MAGIGPRQMRRAGARIQIDMAAIGKWSFPEDLKGPPWVGTTNANGR